MRKHRINKKHPITYLEVPTKKPEVTFETMMGYLKDAGNNFKDTRTGTATRYELSDVVCGTFGVFFTQCGSFLAYQENLEAKYGLSNAKTLFGVNNIPSDTHIRTLLDEQSTTSLAPVFNDCLSLLQQNNHLDSYRVKIGENSTVLVALDGTQYFSSGKVHCSNCSVKKSKSEDTTIYSHAMVTPTLVAPDNPSVLSLLPEFVTPQDGSKKQDCEINASKRWLKTLPDITALQGERLTILGDDLYAHEPFVKDVIDSGNNFIFVCKPESHKAIYQAVEVSNNTKQLVKTTPTDTGFVTCTYRYLEGVPLRAGDEALRVNFVEMTEVTTRTTLRGKPLEEARHEQTYHNAFITDYPLNDDTAVEIATAGRARWKIENENNNSLKTKGYNLEHNFGHGKEQLAAILATLNILAFLFHTILEKVNAQYLYMRMVLIARKRLFASIEHCLLHKVYKSFEHLMNWMTKGINTPYDADSAEAAPI
jgi:hypothetical protein